MNQDNKIEDYIKFLTYIYCHQTFENLNYNYNTFSDEDREKIQDIIDYLEKQK